MPSPRFHFDSNYHKSSLMQSTNSIRFIAGDKLALLRQSTDVLQAGGLIHQDLPNVS